MLRLPVFPVTAITAPYRSNVTWPILQFRIPEIRAADPTRQRQGHDPVGLADFQE